MYSNKDHLYSTIFVTSTWIDHQHIHSLWYCKLNELFSNWDLRMIWSDGMQENVTLLIVPLCSMVCHSLNMLQPHSFSMPLFKMPLGRNIQNKIGLPPLYRVDQNEWNLIASEHDAKWQKRDEGRFAGLAWQIAEITCGGRSREMAVLHSPLDLSCSDTIRDALSSLRSSNPSLTGEDSVVKSEEGAGRCRMGVPAHKAYGFGAYKCCIWHATIQVIDELKLKIAWLAFLSLSQCITLRQRFWSLNLPFHFHHEL